MESFELEDSNGELHHYTIKKPHPPVSSGGGISGIQLVTRIWKAAGGSIATVVNSNVGEIIKFVVDKTEDKDTGSVTVRDITQAFDIEDLSEFDFELPTALNAFFKAIDEIDVERYIQNGLFLHVTRDGDLLRKDPVFNHAYQQNYLELGKACVKIAKYNGFFGSLGTRLDREAEDNDE